VSYRYKYLEDFSGRRIFNGVKVGRVNVGFVFMEAAVFKLSFDGWGRFFDLRKCREEEDKD